ncbi:spermidine/putrescine ABC transporter substrate-binding protein [Nocardioides sp. WL0053]|uniref:Spermidine/putrescine ABC transporter substrate-binding protein n=2 Tax=Nocardioides jiangsuensis TaxID=2866161 RepID=A0ABS7RL68_9ACTN|nr:spermidine/putrescine ABC transporter substrate-binding protein [Nocardioides jiangsuensis]
MATVQTRGVSRRGFLRGASLSALALGSPGLLAACGTEGAKQTAESCVSKDLSATEKMLNFSNWPEYIDVATKKVNGQKVTTLPTLEDFEKMTGIDVEYNTDVNDNAEFFAKVRNQLGACEPTGRDIFVLTDWMAARMVSLGWIQELDHANLPNVDANLVENLKSPAWDPNRDHSVPWQSGLTGIAYNAKYTGEVGSMEELLTRADLKGKVSLLSEMNDTMLFMLRITGADPEKFTDEEFGVALDKLQEYVDSGQIRRFTGNDYVRDLNAGNIAACEAWSGDVIAMQYDNPDIKFVIPEEGLGLWSDNMLVPNKADHKANAEKLMDYYYDPVVAARLAAWVNYICPVNGAQAAMEKIDASLVENPLIFPDAEFLSNAMAFMDLDEKTRQQYEQDFSRVIGS